MIKTFSLAALALTFAAANAAADDPSRQDYAQCLASTDLALCVLTVSQRSVALAPDEDPRLEGAPDIIEALRPHYTPPDFTAAVRRAGRGALGNQISTEVEFRQRLWAMVEARESTQNIIDFIGNAERGRPARSAFAGQVHMNSGAEMRAEAYVLLWRSHVEADRRSLRLQVSEELARAAVEAWEAEASSVNTYANSHLGPRGLVRAYTYFGDEDGLRRAKKLENGGPLTLTDEASILISLGREPDAVELVLSTLENQASHPADQVQQAVMHLARIAERLTAEVNWNGLLAAYTEVLLANAEGHTHGLSLRAPVINAILDGANPPTDQITDLAELFEAQSHRRGPESPTGAFAIMTFELWSRLGQDDRALAVFDRWSDGLECLEAGEAHCRYQFSQSRLVVDHMRGRLNRLIESYRPRSSQWLGQALRIDIENSRGLQNMDAFVELADPSPSQIATDLTSDCLYFSFEQTPPLQEAGEACAEALRTYADTSAQPDAFAIPASDAYIFLAERQIEDGAPAAARSSLLIGLEMASRSDYSPNIRHDLLRNIAIGLLKDEGRLPG
ncbi:hypothetical protein NHF40_11475 [Maricaulaceae bacterium EIL42A08]|nr:hypothetical protein [Maricaulaceae bacterium EIL42A08]